jgi:hypothetical protein
MPTVDTAKRLNTVLHQVDNAPPATPEQRARMRVILADQRETLEILTKQHRKMAAATASEDSPFAGCGMTTATLQALDLSTRQLELLVAVAVMMLAEHDG